MTMNSPRILVLDIETAPILALVWRTFKENIAINQMVSDWYILSFAAKWYGSDDVIYMDQRKEKDYENDRNLVQKLRDLLDQADMVITHYGKRFDHQRINWRILVHGIQRPSSYRMIDTKEISTKYFGATSAKLEFLTEKLNKKYKKLKHARYPGFELWRAIILQRSKDAWSEMEEYNRHDVLALEELYRDHLAAWDSDTNLFVYQDNVVCRCGSDSYKKNGWYYASTRRYQRYKCLHCGYEWRDVRATRCARFTSTVTR